jgi:hypothetical protein
MNHLSGPLLLSAFVFLAPVPVLQAQTANVLSHTVIVAQPPDPIHYEKSIGNYTSTTYPSFFLGTGNSGNGYIYDTQTGKSCAVGIPGYYYERSRTYTYPGDKYAGVIASLFTSVVWLTNPLDYGGSLCGGWGVQTINPNRGAHTLHVVDLDGDGKMDVLASGGEYPTVTTTGFIDFQNNYNSWVLGSFAPPA